jgi:hypothetical protein
MKDSKTLLNAITQQLQVSSKDSQTQAGPTEDKPATGEHIDAINQIFELFRVNYHNQFHKAYPDLESLNIAKRLWLTNLTDYRPSQLMAGGNTVIRESDFLPGLHGLIKHLDHSDLSVYGLLDPHAAFMEACRAPSPKSEHNWSHPAIYFAGRASDWFFLANNTEKMTFPVFERNYKLLCDKVIDGEDIKIDLPKALPEKISHPLAKKEQSVLMKQLRNETGL